MLADGLAVNVPDAHFTNRPQGTPRILGSNGSTPLPSDKYHRALKVSGVKGQRGQTLNIQFSLSPAGFWSLSPFFAILPASSSLENASTNPLGFKLNDSLTRNAETAEQDDASFPQKPASDRPSPTPPGDRWVQYSPLPHPEPQIRKNATLLDKTEKPRARLQRVPQSPQSNLQIATREKEKASMASKLNI